MAKDAPQPKPMRWIGSSRDDVRAFPEPARLRVGDALWEAQFGGKAPWATPHHEIALIEQRRKRAREDHEQWLAGTKMTSR